MMKHDPDEICWVPPFPEEWKRRGEQPKLAINVGPFYTLSFDQLRALASTFDFSQENLVKLRRHLCDGEVHTVASGLFSDQVEAVQAALRRAGLGHEVVQSAEVEWQKHGNGLRSDFDY